MSWQTFRVTDSVQALKVSRELMDGLFAALALHGASNTKHVGIFSHLNLEDGSTDYYFSPRALEIAGHLAKKHHATPCEAPPLIEGMSLLAGDQRLRELLVKTRSL
jgi:hypothetical protein